MTGLESALRPIRRRMRVRRAFNWLIIGVFAGAVGVLLLRAASFMWEFQAVQLWYIVSIVSAPLLSVLTAWLIPISYIAVARQADACGLHARAQTALMLRDSETPMAVLQREDTLSSLEQFSAKDMLPIQMPGFAAIGTVLCAAVFGLSFLIPNPQAHILKAKTEFQTEMKKQADLVEEGAAELDETEAQTQEVRKLLGDLAHELRSSTDPKAALSALDEAERKMTNIKNTTAKETQKALKAAGMGELANALEAGDTEKAEELLKKESEESAAEQLSAAAQSAGDEAAAQQLAAAAQALSSGNSQQALSGLQSAALGQSSSLAQASALSAMARAAAAMAGAKQASSLAASGLGAGSMGKASKGAGTAATKGKASGSGAGLGTSNQDAGYTGESMGTAAAGTGKPELTVTEFEPIYDPTRLGVEGQVTNELGQLGEGEISEAIVGSGLGSIDESVPYNQVLPEYYESAVEAVQNADLPAYAQKWVDSYFSALSE